MDWGSHYNRLFVRFFYTVNPFVVYSSFFQDQAKKPVLKQFREALGATYDLWLEVSRYVFENRPGTEELWYFYGKVGWHIRLRYNKRVIVYCIPRAEYFVVLLVLGDKAITEAMESSITEDARGILEMAAPHSEGRSCYIEVRDDCPVKDIKKLLAIKLFLKV